MKTSEAREAFRKLTQGFFDGYVVIFANQSRMPKPEIPLVTLMPGNVKRPQAPINVVDEEGTFIGYYESAITVTVDLFTNGRAITDYFGNPVAYENTAMDEMLDYADFLNSPKCVEWCQQNDVSILIESDAQDLTGVVNDTNYEYRTRLEVLLTFTQETDARYGEMGYFDGVSVREVSELDEE